MVDETDKAFISMAESLGFPKKESVFEEDVFDVVWTGTGEVSRTVVQGMKREALSRGFSERDIPIVDTIPEDPIVSTLEDLNLLPRSMTESLLIKESGGWRAILMVETKESYGTVRCIARFLLEEGEEK